MASRYLKSPLYLHVDDQAEAPPDIEHSVIEVWGGDKLPVLLGLLSEETEGATIVFGRTRHGVENLARRVGKLGFSVAALQGNLGQNTRDAIMARFRSGRVPVLFATNVAARGIDMLNIDRVINYDLPDTAELFTHRVGRTGRIGRSGQAITLITAADLQKMQEIERKLGRKLPRVPAPPMPDLASMRRPEPGIVISDTSSESATGPRRRKRSRRRGEPALAATAS
jgi:superfamily II DNA/RNA helicase